MKVVRPVTVTPDLIKSSNLVDADPQWVSSTTYSIGQKVTFDFKTWESLTNSNTNNNPLVSPTHWLNLGASNTFALFDQEVNTQSTRNDFIEVTVEIGSSDTISFLNLLANRVEVEVRDTLGGNIIYQSEQSLQGDIVIDWYQYFFFDYLSQRTQAIFSGVPTEFLTAHLTFRLFGVGQLRVGSVIFGKAVDIGSTQYGVSSGIIDYSRKETDEFGNTTFVRRNFSKKLNAAVMVNNFNLNRVQRLLYDIRSIPTLWIASDDPSYEEACVVYGFYRDFESVISYPTMSLCNLQIEGLI